MICVNERGEAVAQVRETVCGGWKCALIDSVGFPFLGMPGKLERHLATDEVFVVVSGRLRVHLTPSAQILGVTHTLLAGEGIRVPQGLWHATWVEGRTVYVIQEAADTAPLNTETIPAWPLAPRLTAQQDGPLHF